MRRSIVAALLAGGAVVLWRTRRLRRLLRRYVLIGGAAARAAGRRAALTARTVRADPDRRAVLDAEFQVKTAEDVARTLGSMKGAFMKVGQLASFVDDGLPEPVRAALAQLQD